MRKKLKGRGQIINFINQIGVASVFLNQVLQVAFLS